MNSEPIHTEKELLLLASQGSEPAFTLLFNRYKHKLYSYLLSLTASPEIAEDIIQDTFLKLWKNRSSMKTIDHLGAYLYKTTRNFAINALKRMSKETIILSKLQSQQNRTNAKTDDTLVVKEVEQLLHQTIQNLPPQQKLIYTLSREQGLKHEDIAHQLHLSSSTVRNHMVQALRTIRKKIEPHSISVIGIISFLML